MSVFARLAFGVIVVLLGVIAYYFFNEYNRAYLPSRVSISRFILASGGFFILYTVFLGRLIIWSVEQILYKFRIGLQDVILLCYDSTALVNWLTKRPDVNKIYHYKELNESNYEQIVEMIKNKEVSEIYLYSNSNLLESKLATVAERYKVLFAFRPVSFGQYSPFSMKPIPFGDFVLLEVSHSNLGGWMVVLKRIFDFVFSAIFIFLFSWLYLIIFLAVKLDSKGPAFYLNERVGPNGNVFQLWKFRRLKLEYCTTDSNESALEYEQELIQKIISKTTMVLCISWQMIQGGLELESFWKKLVWMNYLNFLMSGKVICR
ncbi:hypothetical protein HC864_04595 [Candidatus Gracilibacteria bacterium]|nr:hypothetical protein [Candidatus Gracilibacteria bacterium]